MVRGKWVVGDKDPSVGDHVNVNESKKIFGGLVMKKGK